MKKKRVLSVDDKLMYVYDYYNDEYNNDSRGWKRASVSMQNNLHKFNFRYHIFIHADIMYMFAFICVSMDFF